VAISPTKDYRSNFFSTPKNGLSHRAVFCARPESRISEKARPVLSSVRRHCHPLTRSRQRRLFDFPRLPPNPPLHIARRSSNCTCGPPTHACCPGARSHSSNCRTSAPASPSFRPSTGFGGWGAGSVATGGPFRLALGAPGRAASHPQTKKIAQGGRRGFSAESKNQTSVKPAQGLWTGRKFNSAKTHASWLEAVEISAH
jgi:hypothetical protein